VDTLYKVLGIVGILAIACALGAGVMHHYDNLALVNFQQDVAAKGAAQAAATKAADLANIQKGKDVENDYEKRLADSNAFWSRRLRNTSACSGTVPKTSTTAGAANGSPPNGIPAYPKLIQDCAATTVQLEELQKWVKQTR
jgi:hypothetical protein